MSDKLHSCRTCGALGLIDEEQEHGQVSIICSECGAHYTLEEEE